MFTILKFFGGVISSFDSYSAPVSLLLKGESDVKNIFGGLVSLITLFLSFYLSWGSFTDFVNSSNPSVITNTDYDVSSSPFNLETFFMAISFYSPLKGSKKLSDKFNDRDTIFYLNNLTYICLDCNFTNTNITNSTVTEINNSTGEISLTSSNNSSSKYNLNKKIMNFCNNDVFNNISIKSMSADKANGIITIFQNYSYCFPDDINTNIVSFVDSDSSDVPEVSLQIYIPTQTTKVDFNSVPKNTKAPPSLVPVSPKQTNAKIQSQTTPSDPVSTSVSIGSNVSLNNTHTSQGSTQTKPGQTSSQVSPNQQQGQNQISSQNPGQTSGSTQMSGQPTPQSGVKSTTSPTQGQINSNQSGTINMAQSNSGPSSVSTQPQISQNKPSNTPSQQSQPATTTTSQQSPSTTTTTSQQSPSTTTTTSQQSPSTTTTSPPTSTTAKTSTTTPVSQTQPPNLRNLQSTGESSTNQETSISANDTNIQLNLFNEDEQTAIKEMAFDKMSDLFNSTRYPKILLIHKRVEINLDSSTKNIFKERYELEMLDYKDQLLSSKIVYDIHFKQVRITQQRNGLFSVWSEEKVFIVIDRIEKNTLDTLNVNMGYFNLKLDNDGLNIVVSYVGLPDWLGIFGSFLSTFGLFAVILTSKPAEFVYNRSLLNEIFKYVEERKPNKSKKDDSGLDQKIPDIEQIQNFHFGKIENMNKRELNNLYEKSIHEMNFKEKLKFSLFGKNLKPNSFSMEKNENSLNLSGINKSMMKLIPRKKFDDIINSTKEVAEKDRIFFLRTKKSTNINFPKYEMEMKNVNDSFNKEENPKNELNKDNENENNSEKSNILVLNEIETLRKLVHGQMEPLDEKINIRKDIESKSKIEEDMKEKEDEVSFINTVKESDKVLNDKMNLDEKIEFEEIQKIMILNKMKKNIEEENDSLFDSYVKNVNKYDQSIYKSLKKRKISIFEIIYSQIFFCTKKDKYKILEKCQDFIEISLNINHIINKLFEINFLKSIIFSEKEMKVFDYQNKKFVNLSNLSRAEEYLDSLNNMSDDHKFDIENYQKINVNRLSMREKLLLAMSNRF